jgi:hypothetical protein
MKNIILIILVSSVLTASEYYSKAEPYRFYTLQANVSGLILVADEALEGKKLSGENFIVIDDELDQKELALLKQKKVNLENSLRLNKKMSKNLSAMIKRKSENYERIKDLPIKSSVEKDKEFFDLATTQNQQLTTLEKIETIHSQLNDTKLRLAQLKRSIKDKHIHAKDMVLYKLHVKKGQVVAAGMSLAEVADVSKAKLTIFLNLDEMQGVQKKDIYLNNERTEYKIDKIWPLSDAEHISSYKTEILIDAPQQFSELYKIEFK